MFDEYYKNIEDVPNQEIDDSESPYEIYNKELIRHIVLKCLPRLESHILILSMDYDFTVRKISRLIKNISWEMVAYYRKRGLKKVRILYEVFSIRPDVVVKYLRNNFNEKESKILINFYKKQVIKKSASILDLFEKIQDEKIKKIMITLKENRSLFKIERRSGKKYIF